ncbi:hypothetical protein P8452_13407 [Trifolium repens]|nr:hypothetical protein P8452_13407 [Trifolium repens]
MPIMMLLQPCRSWLTLKRNHHQVIIIKFVFFFNRIRLLSIFFAFSHLSPLEFIGVHLATWHDFHHP